MTLCILLMYHNACFAMQCMIDVLISTVLLSNAQPPMYTLSPNVTWTSMSGLIQCLFALTPPSGLADRTVASGQKCTLDKV
ncbi:hypothetical protein RSOLAG1IB_03277 [Rhizoctonia solani AG-1 IB]|uniref:Secreted protein n=1 Tax=Thanatephorus cucumeris (strain AG1-IB / isolate 7/3/14) TaxID=1108050 RepID=A0A0B7FQZ1_THACB|nr:hypothetical protein RSOLAG1IB_03277 [Rhizoctonia solani AG-1 IB]